MEIKNFLSRNSGIKQRERKKAVLQTDDVGDDSFALGIEKSWSNAETVWETIEGVFNLLAVEHCVRQYSYSAMVILWVLHEAGYFCGVVDTPKKQKFLIEEFVNEVLLANSRRGENAKPPLTFLEANEKAKEVLAANKITSFANYYSGDPYLGGREDELKRKNKGIAELEQELKAAKAEARGGSHRGGYSGYVGYSGRGGQGAGKGGYSRPGFDDLDAEAKKKFTCKGKGYNDYWLWKFNTLD